MMRVVISRSTIAVGVASLLAGASVADDTGADVGTRVASIPATASQTPTPDADRIANRLSIAFEVTSPLAAPVPDAAAEASGPVNDEAANGRAEASLPVDATLSGEVEVRAPAATERAPAEVTSTAESPARHTPPRKRRVIEVKPEPAPERRRGTIGYEGNDAGLALLGFSRRWSLW